LQFEATRADKLNADLHAAVVVVTIVTRAIAVMIHAIVALIDTIAIMICTRRAASVLHCHRRV
jgi:hypothetical protein